MPTSCSAVAIIGDFVSSVIFSGSSCSARLIVGEIHVPLGDAYVMFHPLGDIYWMLFHSARGNVTGIYFSARGSLGEFPYPLGDFYGNYFP